MNVRRALSYMLWPLIFAAALAATVAGMKSGHGVLGFNVTYLALASCRTSASGWRMTARYCQTSLTRS